MYVVKKCITPCCGTQYMYFERKKNMKSTNIYRYLIKLNFN